ncbi:hypothetical protein Aperf_G00000127723 [Anoplocephala perfoliata]
MHRFARSLLISSAFATGCIATGVCLWDGWRSKGPLASLISQASSPSSHYVSMAAISPSQGLVFSPSCSLPKAVAQVGLPGPEPLKILPGFICQYDRRNRIPRWTLELLTSENLSGSVKDLVDRIGFEFEEDKSEPAEFRSTNEDYARSGFDRGHIAAAGNHKFNAECKASTFVLSNVAPQVGVGFNRGAWNDLEKRIRRIARKSASVVVVTGPLFIPGPTVSKLGHRQIVYEVIGPNNVAVPTHFFKAIAVQQKLGDPWKTMAWVLPNCEIPEGVPVDNFIVSLKDVERSAGLIIFPNLNKS